MEKIQKSLDRILTIVLVFCAMTCLAVVIPVIQGKEASFFGYRIYHIMTGSMEPTIPTGSDVIVKQTDPALLAVGDVITFVSKDEAIYGSANTHRIAAIDTDEQGKQCFVTKGDFNPSEDRLRVYPGDIKGKVVYNTRFSFIMFFNFIHTAQGFVTVIVMPMLLVSWRVLKDFRKQLNEIKEENGTEEERETTEH